MPKLGLPFEYQKMPEFFDAWNVSEGTETKNAIIEKLLRGQNVKSVLDMTCGTGSQVFHLAQKGYNVTGSDFSPDLIKIAKAKAKKTKFSTKFIDGDMRTIKAGKFDAVISIFNAVGHLTKTGFEKTMRNIYKNLHDGGVYVFDIFNLEAMNDKVIADFAYHNHAKVDDTQIHKIQFSTIDRANGLLTSYDNYTIQKNAEKPISYKSNFTLQIYTAAELKKMLARNGFEVIGQYDMDGKKFVRNKSASVLTVARKVIDKA